MLLQVFRVLTRCLFQISGQLRLTVIGSSFDKQIIFRLYASATECGDAVKTDMVCITSVLQAPVQSFLRPAMWVPGINRLHSHTETWMSEEAGPDRLLEDIIAAIPVLSENDDKGSTFVLNEADEERGLVRIFSYTYANWLDVMEFTIQGNTLKAYSFSTGLFPLSVPFAFVLNCVFFWVPFYDNGFNKERLAALREAMTCTVIAQDK